ncbi:pyridoxal-phosphate dependent enzyme, partial [Pseudorhodobacter sp.]|uniref:pyridoxal-phosphate dependent enzyme n=1 Tax=Pseudorhodobacter sp. TaxID=1934400 RepID=UPI0026490313
MPALTNARAKTTPKRHFRASPDRPLALLARCPVHLPTPMSELADLAQEIGVASLFAKNEGARMRLGSFKALGGAFAVAQMICEAAGVEDPTAAKNKAATMTFVTASAGNHGLSVAAGARIFGARAVIILPATAPAAFAARIRATGAEVIGG